jgi:hypothetical protein
VKHKGWWDDVPYFESEQQPFSMQVEAEPTFKAPCGFIKLKERHRVRAERSAVNAHDRRCLIRKVVLK